MYGLLTEYNKRRVGWFSQRHLHAWISPRASKSTRRQIISYICPGLKTEQAFLPLILRPFCFRYIFSCLLASAFKCFSIVQEAIRSFKSCSRAFKDLTVFLAALNSQRHALWLANWWKLHKVYIHSYLMLLLLFTNIFLHIYWTA